MIVVDTSAPIAILRAEREAPRIAETLGHADRRLMSAGTLLEAAIVTMHKDDEHSRLQSLMSAAQIEVVALSEADARAGAEAFRRYGRGSGHRAKLNFGDCFAYALARTRGLPLLFKGDDFIHTDVEPALKPG